MCGPSALWHASDEGVKTVLKAASTELCNMISSINTKEIYTTARTDKNLNGGMLELCAMADAHAAARSNI